MAGPGRLRSGLGRRALLGGLAVPALGGRAAGAGLSLGVLSSFSGEYADGAGQGSVIAARLAVEEQPLPVRVLQADMQDRPDLGSAIARAWFDREGVDAVLDVPNSSVALAVATVARERNRVALLSGAGLAAISGAQCGPNHVQWTYDTTALARTAARAVLARGGRSWFFITADYSFGRGLEADAARLVREAGGEVRGATRFAFPDTTDFAAPLLEARASGAEIVGLACTGNHFVTLVKQAAEFGLAAGGQRLACLIGLITNIHAIGLATAQGLLVASPFYWDLDPATRSFSGRFAARFGQPPTMVQAGAYAATRHWLRAVASLGGAADGAGVVARMKALPADDPAFGRSIVRANGSVAHPMHLFEVKSPDRSARPWDYYRLLGTVPAAQAFADPAASGCPLTRPG